MALNSVWKPTGSPHVGNVGFSSPIVGSGELKIFGDFTVGPGGLNEGDELFTLSPAFPIGPVTKKTWVTAAEKPNGGDQKVTLSITPSGVVSLEQAPNNALVEGTNIEVDFSFYYGSIPAIVEIPSW